MNTGHTAEEINENKTMDTDHKAENDIAVAAQRQHEKITRYTRDPTILPKVTICHTIQTSMFLRKRKNSTRYRFYSTGLYRCWKVISPWEYY